MNNDLTSLIDPETRTSLRTEGDRLVSGSGRTYPIVNGIPRFVDAENYSMDFGQQWCRFPKTQLDSYTGLNTSETRLARCLRTELRTLEGKKVLEAGSGAGRFTEVLLKYGATVDSCDFSNAVEANADNNGASDNLLLVQADIRALPFPEQAYDVVMCLGVLQHTPDPEESIECLWRMVKPGGALVIDHYLWKLRNVLPPPFGIAEPIYRRLILSLPRRTRFRAVEAVTNFWFPLHWACRESLLAQRLLRRVSPVHFYYPDHQLRDRQMYYEWGLLDTHDATTDVYKHHRTPRQIQTLLERLGACEIAVAVAGNGVEAFCRKPLEAQHQSRR